MGERLAAPRDLDTQLRIEREAQPVAEERLVQRGVTRGECQRGRVLQDLANLEVLEVRPAPRDALVCLHVWGTLFEARSMLSPGDAPPPFLPVRSRLFGEDAHEGEDAAGGR